MSTQPDGQVTQVTQRGGGRAGRRGGGRGSAKNPSSRTIAAVAAKSKVGPSRLLETEWTKDSILKDSCFVLWLGSGSTGAQQWTVHRPIGETDLEDGSWVCTPTRDIGFLLNRRESEELASWKRKLEFAKRQEVLAARKGRGLDGQTEVWTFDGAPAIGPTIQTCMAAAKAAGAKESEWLSYADQAVRVSEQSFKEALRTQESPAAWIGANPIPDHETMGGPLGDIHQKSVGHLFGLSLNAAKDKVLRVVLGIETNVSIEPTEEEAKPPIPPPVTPKQAQSPPQRKLGGVNSASPKSV